MANVLTVIRFIGLRTNAGLVRRRLAAVLTPLLPAVISYRLAKSDIKVADMCTRSETSSSAEVRAALGRELSLRRGLQLLKSELKSNECNAEQFPQFVLLVVVYLAEQGWSYSQIILAHNILLNTDESPIAKSPIVKCSAERLSHQFWSR